MAEVDVVTDNAIIECKHGFDSVRETIDQTDGLQKVIVDGPLVTFINGTGRAADRSVNGALARRPDSLITNDSSDLLGIIK